MPYIMGNMPFRFIGSPCITVFFVFLVSLLETQSVGSCQYSKSYQIIIFSQVNSKASGDSMWWKAVPVAAIYRVRKFLTEVRRKSPLCRLRIRYTYNVQLSFLWLSLWCNILTIARLKLCLRVNDAWTVSTFDSSTRHEGVGSNPTL